MAERDPTNPFAPREYPQITHAEGCWEWGRGHYDCAMEEIKHLRECAENAEARRAGLEDYINSLRERAEKAERDLKTVFDREYASTARWDAKAAKLESERDEARLRFNDVDLCQLGQAPCFALLAAEARAERAKTERDAIGRQFAIVKAAYETSERARDELAELCAKLKEALTPFAVEKVIRAMRDAKP